jgi:hypothetical protein
MKVQVPILLASLSVLACGIALSGKASAEPKAKRVFRPKVSFNREVKPILSEHCFKCHGPDAAVVTANLRLDLQSSAFKDRNGHAVIVPGNPDKSVLLDRVVDEDSPMPPKSSGMAPLTKEQIDILTRWIQEGAKYEEHWSLVPPKMPAPPKVSNEKWCRNEIDRFVLAQMDKEGLKPEPEADKPTLLRRVAFALTGLAPTPGELKAFLADTKPGAYERMVDRYLASPAYGEHMGRYWLDAIRYGDTHGLHLDNERSIYPYRDWLVRNLNKDLPFDKFTLWQVAGDLLPKPTTEQLIATGFVRMNPTTSEGGAIEEEVLCRNTFDRVDTTSTVYLGMTIGCARCHDHKFDPITQKDYYRLFAFFNSTQDTPLDGNAFTPPPVIRATTPEQEKRLQEYDLALNALRAKATTDEALKWLNAAYVPPLKAEKWEVSGVYPGKDFDEVHDAVNPPETGGGEWKPIVIEQGKVATPVQQKENSSAYVRGVLMSAEAREATATFGSDDGIKIWLNGKLIHNNKVLRGVGPLDTVKLPLVKGENRILIKVSNSGGGDGLIVNLADELQDRIDKMRTLWTTGKTQDRKPQDLVSFYLDSGPASPNALEYRKVSKERAAFEAGIPMTLIAREMEKPRPAYVLRRGEYTLRQDQVFRGIPGVFGSLPVGTSRDRLGLAQWLISDQNPLVARVFVNRAWQQHFGVGIVKTAEDFGSQGEYPTNLPLLDYLAVSFRKDGWSIKKLHRDIVTSATFRQASSMDKAKLEKDPENRFYARGPRFRLDGEVIRDAALEVSGLLNREMGGKGFKPYQPDGLWEAIAFSESTTAKYVRDKGPGIYKRSLYMFIKRTSPPPVLLTFDAPMRDTCIVRRSRTNTPMQALITMNEPMFVEASRVMAEKLIESYKTDEQRIDAAYLLCMSRKPSAKERGLLLTSLMRNRQRYHADLDGAAAILDIGDSPRDEMIAMHEHAAWTILCSTLMNTDEFLTQH